MASAIGLTTALLLLLGGALRRTSGDAPTDSQPERRAPAAQDVWVGRLGDNLVGLLTGVHGDPEVDRAHDAQVRELLEDAPSELSFARLVLFNLGQEPASFEVEAVGLSVAAPSTARSILRPLRPGEAGEPVQAALRALGSLSDRIEVPAGSMANVVVPLTGGVRIDAAEGVETAQGAPFTRRQMTRSELRALIARPRSDLIEDLIK